MDDELQELYLHLTGNTMKYLLLRNNKQTGPYTLGELQAKGLKAYDLIWIEGKSAAWRYPSEVDELKPFAPIVEEQPYDRFFKKPSTQNQPVISNKQQVISEREGQASSFITEYSPVHSNSKSIYVTLPATRVSAVNKETTALPEPVKKQLIRGETISPSRQWPEEEIIEQATTQSFAQNISLEKEEEFSQPQESSGKQRVEKILQSQKLLFSHRPRFVQAVILIISIIGLLSAGIFIGLSINKSAIISNDNTKQKDVVKQDPDIAKRQTDSRNSVIPASLTSPGDQIKNSGPANNNIDNSKDDNSKDIISPQIQPVDKKIINDIDKKNAGIIKKKLADTQNLVKDKPVKDTSLPVFSIASREATHRTDAAVDKEAVKTNITNYVFISTNKYNVGAFGGISALQLTVSNRSLYPLDLVLVEVQYIQANKKVFKTENIYFHNIGAGSSLMQEAPKSPRGIKVQYRITLINSKELGLSYSGI